MARKWLNWPALLPQLRHVAVRLDLSWPAVWLTARDETFWVIRDIIAVSAYQEPSPGRLSRIAASPDDAVWCVSVDGALWQWRPVGSWIQASTQGNLTDVVDDVTVATDGTVWIAARDGTVWTTQDGITFQERTALVGFKRLAAGLHGELWGISTDTSLWMMTANGWFLTNGREMEDLSVSFEGTIWLVARDGSVRTTTDGNGFLRVGFDNGFVSISAGRHEAVWATKSDGTLWVWNEEGTSPPPPPLPPPPPPPPLPPPPPMPETLRPSIDVSTSGSGESSVFVVSGSGFLANTQVTIRGARIEDGQVYNFYWTTNASAQRAINISLPIPCLPGIQISFSANDGRPDPNDLTNRFWSNTVNKPCP